MRLHFSLLAIFILAAPISCGDKQSNENNGESSVKIFSKNDSNNDECNFNGRTYPKDSQIGPYICTEHTDGGIYWSYDGLVLSVDSCKFNGRDYPVGSSVGAGIYTCSKKDDERYASWVNKLADEQPENQCAPGTCSLEDIKE